MAAKRRALRAAMKTMFGLRGDTQRPVAYVKSEWYKLPVYAGLLGLATLMTVSRYELYALT